MNWFLHNIVADDYVFASTVICGAFAQRAVASGDCGEYVLQRTDNHGTCRDAGRIGRGYRPANAVDDAGGSGVDVPAESAVGGVVCVVRADCARRSGLQLVAAKPERGDAAWELSAVYNGNVQRTDGVRACGQLRR